MVGWVRSGRSCGAAVVGPHLVLGQAGEGLDAHRGEHLVGQQPVHPGHQLRVVGANGGPYVDVLDAGRLVEDGTPADLIATYGKLTLEEVFLDVVRGRVRAPLERPEDEALPARRAS